MADHDASPDDSDGRDGSGPGAPVAPASPGAILFVCGMNVIRSPMAEAIARTVLPASTYVASAGVRAGERDPFVDAVLAEVGLKLARKGPQTLDELEDDYFDLIVTLAPEAHHTALELTRSNAVDVVYWPTPDPSAAQGTREQILGAYREVRDHLKAMIERRFSRLQGRKADGA